MVIIKVRNEDLDKIFEILSSNGSFTALPDNRFRIDEHEEDILKKIKDAGIDVEMVG